MQHGHSPSMVKDKKKSAAARLGHAFRKAELAAAWLTMPPAQQQAWIEHEEAMHPGREARRLERAEREGRRQEMRVKMGLI